MTMIVELDASALSQATEGMANAAGIVTNPGSHTFNEVFGPSLAADFFERRCQQKPAQNLRTSRPCFPSLP